MTSEKRMAHASSSKSPKSKAVKPETKPAKANGGGVKLPNGEKHINGAVNCHASASGNGGPGHVTSAQPQVNQWSGSSKVNGVSTTNGNGVNGNGVNGNSHHANHAAKLSGDATAFKPKPAPISFLNVNSTADGPLIVSSDVSKDAPEASTRDKGKAVALVQEPIGTRGANFSPTRPPVFFTTDVGPYVEVPGGHYIKITNVAKQDVTGLIQSLNEAYGWNNKLRGTHTQQTEEFSKFSTVYFCFDDIRDAARASEQVQTVNPACNVAYNSQMEYANAQREGGQDSSAPTAFYDGQVIFMAHLDGSNELSSEDALFDMVHDLAKEHGRVLVIDNMSTDFGNWQFRVEYCSILAAKKVAAEITVSDPEFRGRFAIATKEFPTYDVPIAPADQLHYLEGTVTTPHRAANGIMPSYTSPSGRTAWRLQDNGVFAPLPPPKRVEKVKFGQMPNMTPQGRAYSDPTPQTPVGYIDQNPQGPRNASWSGAFQSQAITPYNGRRACDISGTPTTVDVDNILKGYDVRTTVMLRNLPNDIGFMDLKRILDQTSFGKYDFSYLRVDFTNNLNVGYGFVNFTDPVHIVNFVQRYVGCPWIPGHPTKGRRARIADVSYATVQGYDCLVEKFRNSAVMDEFQNFRPKLWWTIANAAEPGLIGTERDFPPPNNDSKKQRSRDNASTIGLYQSGNRRRPNSTGGRTRQSQWDRGTPAQIEEDAFYSQTWPQMSPLQPGYPYHDPNFMFGGPPMVMGPPPPFPPVGFGPMNGYMPFPPQYASAPAVMDPMGFGQVQFTDPFMDQYGQGPATPGRLAYNGRFNGFPNRGLSPRGSFQGRLYPRGMNGHQLPRAIMEEMHENFDPSARPNGGDMNGHNNNNYPPPPY